MKFYLQISEISGLLHEFWVHLFISARRERVNFCREGNVLTNEMKMLPGRRCCFLKIL